MASMPAPGQLSQQSSKHLDLLYALAYPKRELKEHSSRSSSMQRVKTVVEGTTPNVAAADASADEKVDESSLPVENNPEIQTS